jgi:hypothetical protein
MSNNLLNNTSSLQNILEALQNKATPSGEDVTDETSAYTEKLEQLTTAVTALEGELVGKASSGINLDTCTVTITGANNIGCIAYTSVENGSIVMVGENSTFTNTLTITCLCQSMLVISLLQGAQIYNNVVLITSSGNTMIYKTPPLKNDNATIEIDAYGGGSGA